MTPRIIIKIFIIFLLNGCKAKSSQGESLLKSGAETNRNSFSDDTYCAEVQYKNPNTGTQSSYTLTVKLEESEVVQIEWPNGGKLNGDNFSNAKVDETGHSSFTSDKGYEYEVQIIGQSDDCFKNVPLVKQCIGKTISNRGCRHMTDNANELCWQHQNQE